MNRTQSSKRNKYKIREEDKMDPFEKIEDAMKEATECNEEEEEEEEEDSEKEYEVVEDEEQ